MSTTLETATTAPSTSAVEPLDELGSAVRFDTQCVVIPDHAAQRSRIPRVGTKSYALPLWKRRSSSADFSTSLPSEDALPEDGQSHLVLRVPVPTFSFNKPPATTRSVDLTPLPPCLRHQPSTCASPRHVRPRQPTSPSSHPLDVVTVPLRPCCAACQAVTEAALANGDAWPEHFSRAASRRRSTSVDSPRTITVAGSAASASYGHLGVSISVDEIDKRRRASDTGPSTMAHARQWSNDADVGEECRNNARSSPSPTRIMPATPRIPEEDDDEDESELFPLPSPKRTPRTSPASSPAGSLSSLTVPQTRGRSMNSPTPSLCSGDSHESQPTKRRFLTPPCSSSSSSLSLPKLAGSTTDLGPTEVPARAPSPRLLSSLPSISGRHHSRSPSSHILPTLTDTLPSATDSTPPCTPRLPEPTVPAPVLIAASSSAGSMHKTISPRLSPTAMRLPWRPKYAASTDVVSPTPSFSSPGSTASPKKAFTMPSPRDLISDVLRGVGAMGSTGIGPRM